MALFKKTISPLPSNAPYLLESVILLKNKDWKKKESFLTLLNAYEIDLSYGEGNEIYTVDYQSMHIEIAHTPALFQDGKFNELEEISEEMQQTCNLAKQHQSYLTISLFSSVDFRKMIPFFVKINSGFLKQSDALALYMEPMLFSSEEYIQSFEQILAPLLPLPNVLTVFPYQDTKYIGAYSFGMYRFRLPEIEIFFRTPNDSFSDIISIIYNIANHLLSTDASFEKGEVLVFSDSERYQIKLQKGKIIPDTVIRLKKLHSKS